MRFKSPFACIKIITKNRLSSMKLFRQATMLLALIAPVLGIYAQRTFRVGKIITITNEIVTGYIDTKSKSGLFRECRYKREENSPLTIYTPQDIQAFFIGGNMPRKFVRAAVPSNSEYVFLEVLEEGKVSLYYYKSRDLNYFVQQKGETTLHSLPYKRMERYVDNGYTKRMENY